MRHVLCPRHGVTRLERPSPCYCNNHDTAKRRNQKRNSDNRKKGNFVSNPHMSHIVDRLCSRLDHQSLSLGSRLDKIQRLVALLDLTISDIASMLKKPQVEQKEKDMFPTVEREGSFERTDVI